jgi:hypothetical protein
MGFAGRERNDCRLHQIAEIGNFIRTSCRYEPALKAIS